MKQFLVLSLHLLARHQDLIVITSANRGYHDVYNVLSRNICFGQYFKNKLLLYLNLMTGNFYSLAAQYGNILIIVYRVFKLHL